jgi:hypothetical protein
LYDEFAAELVAAAVTKLLLEETADFALNKELLSALVKVSRMDFNELNLVLIVL